MTWSRSGAFGGQTSSTSDGDTIGIVRDGQPPVGRLLKVLGVAFGLAVLVGNTIGMGILRTPAKVAARLPLVPLFMAVWVAGAVTALLGALEWGGSRGRCVPRSGGLYPLVHDALGEYPDFIVGWTDWLATCGSMAAVAMVIGGSTRER